MWQTAPDQQALVALQDGHQVSAAFTEPAFQAVGIPGGFFLWGRRGRECDQRLAGIRLGFRKQGQAEVRLKVAGTRWWVLSRCDKTSPRRAGGSAVVTDAHATTTSRRSARRDCSQREQFHLQGLPPTFNRTRQAGIAFRHPQCRTSVVISLPDYLP